MSAEILSKQYWLKFGLLGFPLITPRIATNLARIVTKFGVSVWRAVMITRITPKSQSYKFIPDLRLAFSSHFIK